MGIVFNREKDAFRNKIKAEAGGENATAESVLAVLFGHYHNGYRSAYSVKYKFDPYIETTLLQRFNLLWVWPLMLITSPVRFVLTGSIGVAPSGRFGQLLQRLIGHF